MLLAHPHRFQREREKKYNANNREARLSMLSMLSIGYPLSVLWVPLLAFPPAGEDEERCMTSVTRLPFSIFSESGVGTESSWNRKIKANGRTS